MNRRQSITAMLLAPLAGKVVTAPAKPVVGELINAREIVSAAEKLCRKPWQMGFMTVNEVRALKGFPPIPDIEIGMIA